MHLNSILTKYYAFNPSNQGLSVLVQTLVSQIGAASTMSEFENLQGMLLITGSATKKRQLYMMLLMADDTVLIVDD